MKNYFIFLLKIIIKKKNTYILPTLMILLNLITGLIFLFIKLDNYYSPPIFFSLLFLNLTFNIFYSSIKSLNLFSDLEKNGTDLIIFSKPISRKNMILTKTLVFILIGFIWTTLHWVSWTLIYLAKITNQNYLSFSFTIFLSIFFSYLIFGIIASLISIKWSQKAAIIVPLLLSTPAILSVVFVRTISKDSSKFIKDLLDTKYEYHHSSNEADVEKFYLNNNKDQFFIVPNGDFTKKEFSSYQREYLKLSSEYAKNSVTELQVLSWLSVPYQFIDILNNSNGDLLTILKDNDNSNSNSLLYYKNNDSLNFSYKLDDKPSLIKLQTADNSSYSFIIPSLLKSNSKINNDLINRSIIYVREGADKIDVDFPEDEFTYSNPNNLIGKIYWEHIDQVLRNYNFNKFANTFFNDLITKINKDNIKDQRQIKKEILNKIVKEINNSDSWLFNYLDKQVTLFDNNAVQNKKISSEIERKIYFAISLIYYAYFSYNDSILLNSLLLNDNPLEYHNPGIYEITVDGFTYKIGGFASYTTKEVVKTYPNDEKKIVFRYELEKSDNFLFQKVDEVYSYHRDKQVINKNFYPLIWVGLSALLLTLNAYFYYRKDYK
ncbi:ABC transporter permease [Mycoplasma anatis]|uniref:ABC transporter permease n=2 Tax=Mycoplasmopsis anatis TaxID=171279 RepID=A0A9Q3L9T0_9BACT|nr:ABC transporter permease [Mycoplasmopsis anatis]MBW0597054.1 ABC transporter permease [Mycoplasmopsis anatis]MBW0597531.1 ABC transporter permease [Mycoplasmopsis anatis]MBW0600056.1 ABC transporter permease [Mycoplasmopsis anatis]MBW0600451.1 ABC transporter permease [Mycoplasmopsis anatis]